MTAVMPQPDNDSLATRASLLARIKNPDDAASWEEFHETYRRLILGVARKAGLTDEEAQDASQDTLVAVAKNIVNFRYEPERCSFKTWLLTIVRQRIIWQLRKRPPAVPAPYLSSGASGEDAAFERTKRTATVERVPDPASLDLDALWDREWQEQLLAVAIERVKAQVSNRQFQIFDLCACQQWPVAEVARTLRISLAQVYLAKHRVEALVKKEARRLRERS